MMVWSRRGRIGRDSLGEMDSEFLHMTFKCETCLKMTIMIIINKIVEVAT